MVDLEAQASDGYVVAGCLCLVHHRVSRTKDAGDRIAVFREGGKAKTAGECQRQSCPSQKPGGAKFFAQCCRYKSRCLFIRAGHQSDKLVTPIAKSHIGRPKGSLKKPTRLGKQAASNEMPVSVVY